jgi:hypothetical protein
MDPPPYEAISYVWGSQNKQKSLLINGNAVEISYNLFDAIRSLRSEDTFRIIWADAICIDQEDLDDKVQQINIMGDIYENAKSVVVCLGQSTERTGEAMRALRYFTDPKKKEEEPPWSHTTISSTEKCLADIFTHPWFKRVWTVQEATLARHTRLICGEHEVSWSGDLRTIRSILFRIKAAAISPYFSLSAGDTSVDFDWVPLLNILETQARQAAKREGVTLHCNHLDLAFDFRHRKCKNPRDRYYAILGIIENDQGAKLELRPDYLITLEELHHRFMVEIQRIIEIEDVH